MLQLLGMVVVAVDSDFINHVDLVDRYGLLAGSKGESASAGISQRQWVIEYVWVADANKWQILIENEVLVCVFMLYFGIHEDRWVDW